MSVISQVAQPRLPREGRAVTVGLLAVAAAGWVVSIVAMRSMAMAPTGGSVMSDPMAMPATTSMSLAGFMVAWVAMMTAMMLPAVTPVVRLYMLAARRGTVAATPVFVAGYLVLWAAAGLPAYAAWRALAQPLADGAAWSGRVAGLALLLAAVYTVTPLKAACLRHCRSPLGFFMSLRGNLRRPRVALRAGARHGLYCLGCCWALMAVLVAVGVMSVTWMLVLAALIVVEKLVPHGELIGRVAAGLALPLGVLLLLEPGLITRLT